MPLWIFSEVDFIWTIRDYSHTHTRKIAFKTFSEVSKKFFCHDLDVTRIEKITNVRLHKVYVVRLGAGRNNLFLSYSLGQSKDNKQVTWSLTTYSVVVSDHMTNFAEFWLAQPASTCSWLVVRFDFKEPCAAYFLVGR